MATIQQIRIKSEDYQIAIPWYVCSSTKSATTKSISGADVSLVSGDQIVVRFENGNSASAPVLTINNGESKPIIGSGPCAPNNFNVAGSIMHLIYDGNNWNIIG